MAFVLDAKITQDLILVGSKIVRIELDLPDDMPVSAVLKEGYIKYSHAALVTYPLVYAIGYQDTAEDHLKAFAGFDNVRNLFLRLIEVKSDTPVNTDILDHLDLCQYFMISLLYSDGALLENFTELRCNDLADAISMQIRNEAINEAINLDDKVVKPDLHAEYLENLSNYLASLEQTK